MTTTTRNNDDALLRRAYETARERLLGERTAGGYWLGELSSSALSTATAVSALYIVSAERHRSLIAPAVAWLAGDQNADGGWGDSPDSPSNLPTTMLVDAALRLGIAHEASVDQDCLVRSEAFIRRNAGESRDEHVRSLAALYDGDRTFAVPILANCALADGEWSHVPGLPFELACLPHSWFRLARLHVVSYALPALIAMGQLVHRHRPSRNPLLRAVRRAATAPALRRLESIQPGSGGFLEAVPLTSFVTMSLAATGRADHAVCRRGVEFLERAVRPDGSWPIDSNLSNWLTTLAVRALTEDGRALPDADATRRWLLGNQYRTLHPYTNAAPGGWAWTHLPGGVPDADDTAGSLLALRRLGAGSEAAAGGVRWLLDLQNRDGGWPTFCRGWGRLPFDRSAPDLTAHAIRAIAAWPGSGDPRRERRAITAGLEYLRRTQRPDGAWTPLWFGNQHTDEQQNPVYGTTHALAAYDDLGMSASAEARRGVDYLIRAQRSDGAWGGDAGAPASIEETALAVGALAGRVDAAEACRRGCLSLARQVEGGWLERPSPIGLYFGKLWYSERL